MSSLPAGTRLGPYEITDAIGAGGMGEVYKARDTRLDRTVAIKVLPAHVAADPVVRTRFEREARAISSLDHPNICVLHDVGREGDVDYLVMQYLEGETLAARLARGALPLDEALRYATDIAAALDKAHHAGILHRDLKPGNVMLTRSGGRDASAKLLDFGLAKLAAPHAPPVAETQPATITSPLTGQGAVLGTLLYMSPEQLEGRELDPRSDIFSFGAVLYEMVTGTRAFDGPSQASIIGAILERDPPPIASRAPLTPPALERVVRKCLAKDPDRRWQSASDLCDELSWIAQSSGVQEPMPHQVRSTLRPSVTTSLIALTLALAAALAWTLLSAPQEQERVSIVRNLSIAIPDGLVLSPGGVVVSPDGKTIAYTASSPTPVDGHRPTVAFSSARLYLRRFNSTESTPLPGADGARTPFFSPDGLSIAFFTEGALMKMSLLGGTPVRILGVPPVTRGGVWLPDDTMVLSLTQSTGLFRAPASGGKAQPLTTPDPSQAEKGHMWPAALPGGADVLYTIRRGTASNEDDADVAVVNVASGQSRVILRRGAYARYSPTGHLLFVRDGTLMAVPFDLASNEVQGTPSPAVQGLSTSPWIGGAHYAVSPDGVLVFMRGAFGQVKSTSAWVDRAGKPLAAPAFTETDLGKPRISPDGKRALFDGSSAEGDGEIYVADLTRGTTVRFTADPGDDFNPVWTPDGRRIIWTTLPAASLPFLVWRAADGTGAIEVLVQSTKEAQFAGSVSPDGILAFSQSTGGRISDIWVVPLQGERKPRQLVAGPADEFGPEFSPDGKWIAYVSNETGTSDVYVVPYPGPGGKHRVSAGGGVAPAWSRDGKELLYQSGAGMMSVPVSVGPDLQFGVPRLLFSGNFVSSSRSDGPREYDVAPGGDRFLMIKVEQVAGARPPAFEFLSHWWTELGRPGGSTR